ncbi:MAG: hypothetical protein ACD_19C00271G0001 [uncultured bacterium]|nr:MAG: hypothetical protein ACD_19C00271G0001 [uncultured bacterium]
MSDPQNFLEKTKNLEINAPQTEREVVMPESEQTQEKPIQELTPIKIQPEVRFIAQTEKPKRAKPTMPQVKDEMTQKIEKIMEEDLKDAFLELTPVQKQEFKIKGDEVLGKIRLLMNKTKINIKKIIKLLLSWLKILPGINKFFLEQEAKIKADKILALKHFAI